MLCLSAGGMGRDSPTAALDRHWEPALPVHPRHQDGEWERSISNTAAFEEGLGHPDLSPGLAWSRLVLGLASAVPMAKAVLAVLLVGEELRGVQMDLIFSFYCCQNPQGAARQECLARGGSGGTVPKHPA